MPRIGMVLFDTTKYTPRQYFIQGNNKIKIMQNKACAKYLSVVKLCNETNTGDNNMMNTKEVKEYYERNLQEELEMVLDLIKTQGITDDTYTHLRHLQSFVQSMNSAEKFFGAWHSEGSQQQKLKKAV